MHARVSRILLAGCLLATAPVANADAEVRIGEAEYAYHSPRIHEMHLKLPVTVDPVGGNETFVPTAIEIDGKKADYFYFYFDGATVDYLPHPGRASEGKIELYVPIHWRAGERHDVALQYSLDGKPGRTTVALPTPKTGGAWGESTDNLAFRVREEAGLARTDEPVDIDLTVEQERFPDPERRIRATVMTEPGRFTEIPCQVYDVQAVAAKKLNRFRAVVPLTVKPKTNAVVHLWVCPPRATPPESAIRLEGEALGGVVRNAAYRVELERTCGQLVTWLDTRLGVQFQLQREDMGGQGAVIHRTPDLYRPDKQWSHALDWTAPEHRAVAGPVMVETTRRGEMPWIPEAFGKVRYRFFAGRPEVRSSSSLRVTKDIEGMAVRNGNFCFSIDLFTHAAWPESDGTLRRVTIQEALGDDMGAPPQACFPVSTPWVAVYHRERNYGFALLTANHVYFSEGPGHANEARARAYVSNYRNRFLYTVRASTQTYRANTRSHPTPIEAGTTLYEDVAYLPFAFSGEDERQFEAVWSLHRELKNPLVVEY